MRVSRLTISNRLASERMHFASAIINARRQRDEPNKMHLFGAVTESGLHWA